MVKVRVSVPICISRERTYLLVLNSIFTLIAQQLLLLLLLLRFRGLVFWLNYVLLNFSATVFLCLWPSAIYKSIGFSVDPELGMLTIELEDQSVRRTFRQTHVNNVPRACTRDGTAKQTRSWLSYKSCKIFFFPRTLMHWNAPARLNQVLFIRCYL